MGKMSLAKVGHTWFTLCLVGALLYCLLQTLSRAQVCDNGDIRLTGGSTRFEGRIEVCLNDAWGTVCDDGLTSQSINNFGRVVCRQLGLNSSGGILTTENSVPTTSCFAGGMVSGTIPIHLDDVVCTGDERKLIECTHRGVGVHNCRHHEDTGIRCSSECVEGTIRLADDDFSGHVELCYRGLWSTITVSDLGTEVINVICRELGLSDTAMTIVVCNGTGAELLSDQGTGHIVSLDCLGNETQISECTISQIGCYNHTRDSGVVCGRCVDHCGLKSSCKECPTTTTMETQLNTETPIFTQIKETTASTANVSNSVDVCSCSSDTTTIALGVVIGILLVLLMAVTIGWIATCIVVIPKRKTSYDVTIMPSGREHDNPTYGAQHEAISPNPNKRKTSHSCDFVRKESIQNQTTTSYAQDDAYAYIDSPSRPEDTVSPTAVEFGNPLYESTEPPNTVESTPGEYGHLDRSIEAPEGPMESRPRWNKMMNTGNDEYYSKTQR